MVDKQTTASERRDDSRIFSLRGQQVMLSVHLARMHRMTAQKLEEVIARQRECFPPDSMFQLTQEEITGLDLPAAHSGHNALHAFTPEGVAVLACILFDERELHENPNKRAATCRCPK